MPVYSTTRHPRFWRTAPYVLIVAAFAWGLHDNAETSTEGRNSLVKTGRIVSVDGCNRDFETISNLRAVLVRGRASVQQQLAGGNMTADAAQRAIAFYNENLQQNPLPDCRRAAKVISDSADPNAPLPVPRYPGDGQALPEDRVPGDMKP